MAYKLHLKITLACFILPLSVASPILAMSRLTYMTVNNALLFREAPRAAYTHMRGSHRTANNFYSNNSLSVFYEGYFQVYTAYKQLIRVVTVFTMASDESVEGVHCPSKRVRLSLQL